MSGKRTQLHSGLLPEPCMSPCSAASGDHDAVQAGIRPAGTNISANELYRDASNRTLSFHLWCSELLRLVLRSRTSFSAFVIKAIRLPRDDTISTSAIYPVPLPHPEAFRRMPPGCSSKKRRQIHFLRAVNLVVLALDFWALDGKITDLNLLGRRLNIAQKAIVSRVRSLMLADGPDVTGTLTSSGRKFPQLVARLSELSGKVTELGVGAGPYSKVFQGVEVPLTVDSPELVPYRSLDSSRLKLTGTGHWDATTFLNDELAMVYRYPDILLLDRVPRDDEYPKFHDDAGEVGRLARLWDSRGLLFIHQVNFKQHVPHEAVRVFNNYKAVDCDRQIGDRRGRNAVEARVCGPSATLPGGADLADLWLSPKLHRFSVNITDRSDFYHQFWVSENRALANSVLPPLPLSELVDTKAMTAYALSIAQRGKDRLKIGDGLRVSSRQCFGSLPDDSYIAAFRSIFQGDHSGVEIATDAHIGLLQRNGLLLDAARLESHRPFVGGYALEGLVIDDYFTVGIVDRLTGTPVGLSDGEMSAHEKFLKAKNAYKGAGLVGSDHKDIVDSAQGKVIGAWLNSSDNAARQNVATLGGPPSKRYGLSHITLNCCQLSSITDVLLVSLLGGWTSLLGYRRPLLSILNESYHLVNASEVDSEHPCIVGLSRQVCQELTLISILAPLAVSDLGVGMLDHIFATDASNTHGAIVTAEVDSRLPWIVSRCCKSKGAYARILSPSETLLKSLDILEETGEEVAAKLAKGGPSRPLAFRYDFIEVYAGAAVVSDAVASLGYVVGPPLDLSYSVELDGGELHVLSWIVHMLMSGHLYSVICEPPCTSFSIMRRPPLRSTACIFGFVSNRQTRIGNLLAQRSFQVSHVARAQSVTSLLETPWSSKMKKMPSWRKLASHDDVSVARVDSCMYGSIHRKSFALLGTHANFEPVSLKCDGTHTHVPVQGKYTKASATYTPGLAAAIAKVIEIGICRKKDELREEDFDVKGLEDQLLNEILVSSNWQLVEAWPFKAPHHINILEMAAVLKLVKSLVKKRMSCRVVVFVDSNVIRCAVNKGRSSSHALSSMLKQLGALAVGGGIYLFLVFSPTRLNPADDPTRGRELRSPQVGLDLQFWRPNELQRLSSVSHLKRFASNWVRLVLRLLGPSALWYGDRSLYRSSPNVYRPVAPGGAHHSQCRDFDATIALARVWTSLSLWILFSVPWSFCLFLVRPVPVGFLQLVRYTWTLVCSGGRLGGGCGWSLWVLLLLLCSGASHGMPLHPRNPADFARFEARQQRPQIEPGRPVLEVTSSHRRQYLQNFMRWCQEESIDFEGLLETYYWHIEEINTILEKFGRCLYAAGWPYNHYAETINAIGAKKPAIRRQLQGAWDFAYGWVRDEPPSHHRAMPWQVLLAMLTTALSWGWLKLAGMMALSWGSLLRVGEFCAALRGDLLLPEDTHFTNRFSLLAIREPKTRFSAARHQSAKLDIGDLLEVVSMAFFRLQRHQKLWPHSAQTLRNRFRQVLQALNLPTVSQSGNRALDLGSLRPGGATWLLQQYESGELVQRRGRWMNYKVMQIYIQEVGAFQYLASLDNDCRTRIYSLAESFPATLETVKQFHTARIPESVWYKLLMAK